MPLYALWVFAWVLVCLQIVAYFRGLSLGVARSVYRNVKWWGTHSNG